MKGFGGVIISKDPSVLLDGTQRESFSKKGRFLHLIYMTLDVSTLRAAQGLYDRHFGKNRYFA